VHVRVLVEERDCDRALYLFVATVSLSRSSSRKEMHAAQKDRFCSPLVISRPRLDAACLSARPQMVVQHAHTHHHRTSQTKARVTAATNTPLTRTHPLPQRLCLCLLGGGGKQTRLPNPCLTPCPLFNKRPSKRPVDPQTSVPDRARRIRECAGAGTPPPQGHVRKKVSRGAR